MNQKINLQMCKYMKKYTNKLNISTLNVSCDLFMYGDN